MGKRLARILLVTAAAFAGLTALVVVALWLGGPWAVERFLRKDIAVGEGSLRFANPQFRWNLDLTADTLRYASPALDVKADGLRVSVNLFRSLFRFSPSLDLDLAEADLRFKAVDDSLEEKVEKPEEKGPPAFKPFDLPASVKVRVGKVAAAGDTAELGSLRDVTLTDKGKRAARLTIGEAALPALGALRPSLSADLDWGGKEDVAGVIEMLLVANPPAAGKASSGAAPEDTAKRKAMGTPGDGLRLEVKAGMSDLRKARLELKAKVASIARYAALLGPSPYVAGSGGWDGTLKAEMDVSSGWRASLRLEGRYGGLSGPPDKVPLALGPQDLSVRFGFRDTAGFWQLGLKGAKGEHADLAGRLSVIGRDSLENPAWLGRHMQVTLSGRAGGFPVRAAGKTVTAELDVDSAADAPGRARVEAATGDGSLVRADLKEGKKGWNGNFSLEVAPGEAWMLAFVDTNVAFRRFTAAGTLKDGNVRAVTDALYLKAYGVEADTLAAVHRYGKAGYVLESGRLARKGTAWDLSGKVELAKRGRPLAFKMDGGSAGSVEFRMPSPDVMEAAARNLAPDRIPYQGLDSFSVYVPRVTADFRWDRKAREGEASADATGRFRGEAVRVAAKARWDKERLEVERLDADLGGSHARAAAAVKLKGRQFFELKGLGIGDVDSVALEAYRFDLGKAARLSGPKPPVTAGTLDGRFRYAPATGFHGSYRVDGLKTAAAADLVTLKELRLRGDGDTLRILAVTVSKKEPLLNDSLSVFLSGVLEKTQILGFQAKVGSSLRAGFLGRMESFKDLEGVATLGGSLELPNKSGILRGIKLNAVVSLPFKDAMEKLKVEADTLLAEYVVPGIDTQAISAPLRVAAGKLVIPDLTLKGRSGSSVRGRVEYALAGTRLMQAQLAGTGLVVQSGPDKIQLRDLSVNVRLDTNAVNVTAKVGSGSFEHVKSPIRAAGDFSKVDVSYRSPLGKAPAAPANGNGTGRTLRGGAASKLAPAVLKVSAVLDTSSIRYRLRSFSMLKNVFKKSPRSEKRTARAGRPLEVSINVETAGAGNSIETDVLRFAYVGNFSLRGQMPYALVNGRVTGTSGELGTQRQAYAIRELEVKWLNAPPEEGELSIEAVKRLKKTCEPVPADSCNVVTRLVGSLSNPQFAYDSDCEGGYGSGANVAALLYSVRRGCYSNVFAGGGSGLSYEEQALALLEPLASQYLTRYASKLTSNWIESADVTGLGALAQEKNSKEGDSAASAREAVALEVLSKEFWRLRLRIKTGYQPQDVQESDPWAYRVGLEWKPPLFRLVEDAKWKQRIKNNVVVEAAVFRDPSQAADPTDNSVQRRVGLNYNYDWWGYWWKKK